MLNFLQANLEYIVFAAACVILLASLSLWLRRHRRASGISRVTWALLAAILAPGWVLVNDAGLQEYQRMRSLIEGFAPTYALEMEQLDHAQIRLDTSPRDPLYISLINAEIRWLKANPAVSDIYTFRKRSDGAVVLVVDSETDYDHNGKYEGDREARTAIGEVFTNVSVQLERAFLGQAAFDDVPYTDRWGTWVSAFVPMFNEQGKVDAVLGVDCPASEWQHAMARGRADAVALLAVVVVILLASTTVNSLLRADMADRQRVAEELRLAKEAAEAASCSKSEFLANMSHEIRTPMTAILGYADLMSDPTQGPSDRLDCIQTIRRNGAHLLSIINDILDISKIEAGKMSIERIACAPNEIVADVASLMRGRALEKRLDFAVDYPGPIPQTILTDPTRLRQILINLCGNGVKFTRHGGVRIICRMATPVDTERPRLRFEIMDTGVGLTPEQLSRLFEPFTQSDSSTTREFGGTGLGLSISKRLAGMLGGDITVQSTHGLGSTFSLEIETGPLQGVPIIEPVYEAMAGNQTATRPNDAAPACSSDATPSASQTTSLQGLRILLAEDGPDNQWLIGFQLRKAGAAVTIAENGRVACERALTARKNGAPFDVILMDMQMPEVDGYGAASYLRRKGYAEPIIALTAHAMLGDRDKCIRAGCDDYATKPIDRAALLALIADWGRRARLPQDCRVGDTTAT